MKPILFATLITSAILTTSAFAAQSGPAGNSNFLLALFLGFFALIIVFQLVPATLMLVGILRGLFGRDQKTAKVSR